MHSILNVKTRVRVGTHVGIEHHLRRPQHALERRVLKHLKEMPLQLWRCFEGARILHKLFYRLEVGRDMRYGEK